MQSIVPGLRRQPDQPDRSASPARQGGMRRDPARLRWQRGRRPDLVVFAAEDREAVQRLLLGAVLAEEDLGRGAPRRCRRAESRSLRRSEKVPSSAASSPLAQSTRERTPRTVRLIWLSSQQRIVKPFRGFSSAPFLLRKTLGALFDGRKRFHLPLLHHRSLSRPGNARRSEAGRRRCRFGPPAARRGLRDSGCSVSII
jgi:hypothetical protein